MTSPNVEPSETPCYRATRDLGAASLDRHRNESPFAAQYDGCWQYGKSPVTAGQIIESRDWPDASFHPLNHSAKAIHSFFTTMIRSRMGRSPFGGDGQLNLDNAMSFGGTVPVRPGPASLRGE